MQSILDLLRGIIRHPIKTVGHIFTAISVMFTVVKVVTHFIPGVEIAGPIPLMAMIFLGLCHGARKVWKPSKILIEMPHSNTIIEVLFGNIFEQSGIKAISVNDFFDSKLGKPVSDKSVHGMFLQKCFGGHPEAFDKQVEQELKSIPHEEIIKVDGKTKRYPIGTTALIGVNSDKYIVFAFAKSDPETCKAGSDVTMMWIALHELWERARNEAGGHSLNLPLVGSGLSGLGLPTRDLLNLIILSAITETKSKEITQRIRIVLHRSRFDDLDLRDVKMHWEEK